jgi:hypothetical protein
MNTFTKVVRPGTVGGHDLFCKAELREGGALSFTGVVGPTKGGNCWGSAGQVIIGFKEYDHRGHMTLGDVDVNAAGGWTAELVKQFFDAWDRWHMNDMRAGCEHQRAEGWGKEMLEVVRYRLTPEVLGRRTEIEKQVLKQSAARGVGIVSAEEQDILNLKSTVYEPGADEDTLLAYYAEDKREKKPSNWVHQDEHASGVLMKPCQVCGYRYGSAWCKEEVPESVLEFLKSLPDTDTVPAWV